MIEEEEGEEEEENATIFLACTSDLCSLLGAKDSEARQTTFHHPANVSTANYSVALPDTARVVCDFPSLTRAALRCFGRPVVRKFGGWVIEEEGGGVFIFL